MIWFYTGSWYYVRRNSVNLLWPLHIVPIVEQQQQYKKGQTITTLPLSFSVNHKTFSPNYIDQSGFIPTKYTREDEKKTPQLHLSSILSRDNEHLSLCFLCYPLCLCNCMGSSHVRGSQQRNLSFNSCW